MLHLYDTATREVRELAMREPGTVEHLPVRPDGVRPAALGHGRATLVYDVLRRYLEWTGLQRAPRQQRHRHRRRHHQPRQQREPAVAGHHRRSASRCGSRRWASWVWPGPPTYPTPPQYVEQMVSMIGQLVDIGRGYVTDDGVYLSVESVEDYGLLVNQHLSDMIEGGGDREVFGAENKHHPADFVLWKMAKPGEPSWPSPWGDGRPGWHSECVVMSLDILGEGFDLHCGGMDLKFPHHENERAQAVALGKRFANHWMHNGFVVDAEGEKMSKSLGNVANLLDLMDHYDPRAYRMLLLQSHYRGPVSVGQDNIDASVNALAGLDSFASRTAGRRRRRSRRRRARPVPRADGRRSRHARRDGAVVRHRPTGQRRARRRRSDCAVAGGRGARDLHGVRVGAQRRRRCACRRSPPRPQPSTQPASPRTLPPPTRSAAELQAAGWTVETTKAGTTLRR